MAAHDDESSHESVDSIRVHIELITWAMPTSGLSPDKDTYMDIWSTRQTQVVSVAYTVRR